jgi:hypothetical protein
VKSRKSPQQLLTEWRGTRTFAEAAQELAPCSASGLLYIEQRRHHPGMELAQRIEKIVGIPALAWNQSRAALRAEKRAKKLREQGRAA